MKALLLGSIGTLADTSELQRWAFNAAFHAHGLDWDWDRETYAGMLTTSGGADRIARHAATLGHDVDVAAVHATKSDLFQSALAEGKARMRPGLDHILTRARQDGMALGLVTTTEPGNVEHLLRGLDLDADLFDVVTTREDVAAPKPAPDCYRRALGALGLRPDEALAIEDNVPGVRAAQSAGVLCLIWPNENTGGHDFPRAARVSDDITRMIWAGTLAA
ncbi:HAD-IA family hydrolase [Jannaschia sp. LMIT008]|uniref:HAD family hydrolase n=1 Tax=Jannaschia maritima TaxID=3032585 RepID=UPI0028121C51|nr:HAD-IA family hydrolase [Jannaschia sp. LMIT008]